MRSVRNIKLGALSLVGKKKRQENIMHTWIGIVEYHCCLWWLESTRTLMLPTLPELMKEEQLQYTHVKGHMLDHSLMKEALWWRRNIRRRHACQASSVRIQILALISWLAQNIQVWETKILSSWPRPKCVPLTISQSICVWIAQIKPIQYPNKIYHGTAGLVIKASSTLKASACCFPLLIISR